MFYYFISKFICTCAALFILLTPSAMAGSSNGKPQKKMKASPNDCLEVCRDSRYNELAGYNFEGCAFQGYNFANANLRNTNFKNANLAGVDFKGADLRGCDFSKASFGVYAGDTFKQVNFCEANLEGAFFLDVDLSYAVVADPRNNSISAPITATYLRQSKAYFNDSTIFFGVVRN